MGKIIFKIGLLSVLLMFGCEEELPIGECGKKAIFMEEDGTVISDPFQITAARIEDKCLAVEVTAGGCDGESWEANLFIYPLFAESYPPQGGAILSFKDEELCEAAIKRTFYFDLSALDQVSDRVILSIDGYDEALLYPGINTEEVQGAWHLMNVSGGLAGIDDRFEKEEIVWDFNEKKVEIKNTNTDETKQDIFESGTYTYGITKEFEGYHLQIDDNNLGLITFLSTDSLIIDQRAVDGFKYTLLKFK
ncbi:MAG: hypothetical protein Tsb0034_06040 [Ekhidna sp.]